MPEAVFLEAGSFSEVLGDSPVCLEWLPLHANRIYALANLSMAQCLRDGCGSTFLLGAAFASCFRFFNLTRWVDPASPGRFGKHGWRNGAPKTVCAIFLRRSIMPEKTVVVRPNQRCMNLATIRLDEIKAGKRPLDVLRVKEARGRSFN